MTHKFELIGCIFGPMAFSILILIGIYSTINYFNTKNTNSNKKLSVFKLDADRGLAEQGYLWLSILTPASYFFIFGLISWSSYTPSFTSGGFDTFIKISALPLALLSLSIPLTALVARVHATHQTSVQIATTRYKNNIDAYYAHRKAMFEYFGGVKEITYAGGIKGDFHAHPRLHLRFFIDKGPANGTPEVNPTRFIQAVNTLSEIQEHIHCALTRKNTPTESIKHYAQACSKLFTLSATLNLPCIYEDLKLKQRMQSICLSSDAPEAEDLKFHEIGKGTEQLIGSYRYTRSFLRVLCEFAGHEVSFFDQKRYPSIDKGNDYRTPPYHIQDIADILKIVSDTSSMLSYERYKKQQEKINAI